jgi:two-component system sensor histidine kinase VicK
MLAAIPQAVKGKRIFEPEHRVLHADGSPGWTLSRAAAPLDEASEIME